MAPPPALSTPPQWVHLAPAGASSLQRRERARALSVEAAAARHAASEQLASARRAEVAEERATFVQLNAGGGREKRASRKLQKRKRTAAAQRHV
jgi:hypothetical protein